MMNPVHAMLDSVFLTADNVDGLVGHLVTTGTLEALSFSRKCLYSQADADLM